MVNLMNSPYVGPRTFREEEKELFFGREQEAKELISLVMSERLVVFYAQSGAGKSSLINTRLRPGLIKEGFKILPVARVSGSLAEGVPEVDNIFVFNLILSLDQSQHEAASFTQTWLTDYLQQHHLIEPDGQNKDDSRASQTVRLLIIDQFEEILTTNLEHWEKREEFFKQLQQAMQDDPLLWVVLSLREDYVAALNPYARLLPGRLRTRFYMRRLGYHAALEAIEQPAKKGGRPFAPGVAQTLVDNLRVIRSQDGVETHLGEFVEPVQLQVVCYQLWEKLRDQPVGEITEQDLKDLGDVDTALAQFYEQAIAKVLAEHEDITEAYLRDWFDRRLITEAGTRGIVYRGAQRTGGLPTPAADALANQFLLRTETRAGGIWYELVHDRFVNPILKANQAWRLQQGIFEELDSIIGIKLSNPELTVEVERTAIYELEITNTGAITAQFMISVQGLDQAWVTLAWPLLILAEGERKAFIVNVTPPRRPTSRTGAHHFNLIITSPDYPNRQSERQATLHIKPYYEFTLSDLSPKSQTISWFKRYGETVVSVANKGNSQARFMLEGADNAQSCTFEFALPGEETMQAQQAIVSIPADSSLSIPIYITPYSRRLVGLSRERHDFTITVNSLEEQLASRSILGQLRIKSLFGSWVLSLLLLMLLILIVYIFRPTINFFTADPQIVRAGEEVTLRWNASPFANLRIGNGVGPVESAAGEVIIEATGAGPVAYELRAENWLSAFSAAWFTDMRQVSVQVEPVRPIIRVFSTDKEAILTGEEVTLSWEVIDADELILLTNGNPETILSTEHTSQRIVAPLRETTYTLVTRNSYGEVSANVTIQVMVPTATPVPTPFVRKFLVNPSVIIAGTPVLVEWEVEDADTVSILPIGSELPPAQTISQSPQQNTTYVLNAAKGSSAIQPIAVQVFVTPPPTATPELQAPVIEFFTASNAQIEPGDDDPIDLAWSIAGPVTNVEISSPDFGTFTNLASQGVLPITIDKSTIFVLTAFNRDKVSSVNIQIRMLEPEASAPKIEAFTATAKRATDQTTVNIELAWSVSGDFTNIQISSPHYNTISNLSRQDRIELSVDKTTVFVLTAFNSNAYSSQTVKINIAPIQSGGN